MVRHFSWALLPAVGLATAPSGTVEIAPGVDLPLLSSGISNRTVWLQAGGKGLDTALDYGDSDQGQVGRAVLASGRPRSELFVTTKIPCCPAGDDAYGQAFCEKNPHWQDAAAAVQHNYDILGLDYVDLLLLHWTCDTLEDSLAVYSHMEEAVRSGRAHAIGVSNFNASFLEAFMAKVSIKPAVNQVSFSIGGHYESESPFGKDDVTHTKCKELGVTLQAWAPLGGTSGVDVLHEPHVTAVAAYHNKSTAQVALRWLLQQGIPAVTATDSSSHAASDFAVYDFMLTDQEMAILSAVKPDSSRSHDSVVVV